jgi:two-component system sensor histidine kinase UhpB
MDPLRSAASTSPDPATPPAAVHPLDLPRLVMRRAAVVVVLGVLLLWGLGLVRMHDTVADELAGARTLAQLAERLSSLQALPDEAARRALQDWQREAALRHLRVRVVDAYGLAVVDDVPSLPLSAPMRWLAHAGVDWMDASASVIVAWPLARPDADPWQVSLTAVPDSERVEAFTSLLDGVLLLAGVGALMLAVMAWNTRHAFAPLTQLLSAIGRLALAPRQGGELRASQLPTMPIAELETIAAALRRLDAALDTAEQQRRRLASQVLSLQEDERQRLARELHDEFGQRLTALRVNAAWLARQLQHDASLLSVVQDMAHQCEDIQQDVRAMLARLRPLAGEADDAAAHVSSLAELGRLLQGLVADWQRSAGRQTEFTLRLQAHTAQGSLAPWPAQGEAAPLGRDVVLAVFRISQEALTNVARHAQEATHAVLHLSVTGHDTSEGPVILAWSVEDDGAGLPEVDAAFSRGNGLAGLKERLWALGSDLQIGAAVSADGQRPGCRLSAQLVLPVTERNGA